MTALEQALTHAVRLVEAAHEAGDTVVLACHVGPDGDALGSMLAAGLALRARGTKVVASWGSEPFAVPDAYAALEGLDLLVPAADVPEAPALLVTFDTGSTDRLGALEDRVGRAAQVLNIDHHASNTRFGSVDLVDPTAAATAVLVLDLLDALELPLTRPVAAALYTGLVTDTGSFRYSATTPAVHQLAARLLATGIRHDLISRAIWDTAPFGYVQLLGEACARAQLDAAAVGGLGLVWTVITAGDLARHGLGLSDAEGVIDSIRVAREAEVAVVLKDDPADGLVKVSTRSKGRVDVGAACTPLGGGGHRFAAGFSATDAATALERLRVVLAAAPHLEP